MHEIKVNVHMHSYLSDGHATYAELARAAMQAGLDAIIVTDHNVFVDGAERWYQAGKKKALVLTGQEVHDQARDPQKNHLLVFNNRRDYSALAENPVNLVRQIKQDHALSFIAHPFEHELKPFGEPDISWVDRSARGFTGIELWNGMSELKSRSNTLAQAAFLAFFPTFLPEGPLPQTLAFWDDLLNRGIPCAAIGGSDAHAFPMKAAFFTKTIFPYVYHFSAINNHLLINNELTGNIQKDKAEIMEAFSQGRLFVGYDLPQPTTGFRFFAQVDQGQVEMGGTGQFRQGATLHARLPSPAEVRLLRDGKVVFEKQRTDSCTYFTEQAGTYRLEAYIHYRGKKRGWIFSNPVILKRHGSQ
jgi:hypothetical protein